MSMTRLKPDDVASPFGAPMGRRNVLPADTNEPVKLRMVKLRWVDGDYDEGGAYWGSGNGSSDIYYATGDASDVVAKVFVRAVNREEAKSQVKKLLPNARFFR